jgi:hypothetical protein
MQANWVPKTTPPLYTKHSPVNRSKRWLKLIVWLGVPLVTGFEMYRFQTPYDYTSKLKPYKQQVKDVTTGITASLKELREKEKLDLGNKSVTELAPLVCKNSTNKSDCTEYWNEYHKLFLKGVEENKPPKLNMVHLYAKKYVQEHGETSSHSHH